MTIGEKIKEYALLHYGSLKGFAVAIDIDPSNLQAYITGKREPGFKFLGKLAKVGFDINSILTERIDSELTYSTEDPTINHVPKEVELRVLGTIPASINKIEISDWITTSVLDVDPKNHALMQVDAYYGESMKPIIQPGDYVLISFKRYPFKDNDLIAARWDKNRGGLKLMKYHYSDPNSNMIMLYSANSAVEPFMVDIRKCTMYHVVAWFNKNALKPSLR